MYFLIMVYLFLLQEILPQMVQQWPNMKPKTAFDSFWYMLVIITELCATAMCTCDDCGEKSSTSFRISTFPNQNIWLNFVKRTPYCQSFNNNCYASL